MSEYKTIEELRGKTITAFESNANEAIFTTSDGKRYQLYHSQDCYESVTINEVEGDTENLLNSPVLDASEDINSDVPEGAYYESVTFSNFTITTAKGVVVIRWIGESNGYYSESVTFIELAQP